MISQEFHANRPQNSGGKRFAARQQMFARLLRGIGANALSQVVSIGLQLALVPVLATHWGLKLYGTG